MLGTIMAMSFAPSKLTERRSLSERERTRDLLEPRTADQNFFFSALNSGKCCKTFCHDCTSFGLVR